MKTTQKTADKRFQSSGQARVSQQEIKYHKANLKGVSVEMEKTPR